MVTQPGGKRHASLRVWIRLFRPWWKPLKWFWVTIVLVFVTSDGATLLITKNADVNSTPLGWLIEHFEITLPLVGALLLFTYLAYLADHQAEIAASLPVRSHPLQAPALPKSYVSRPKAFNDIKHLLLNRQGSQTTTITTALHGAGGFGKTTLAVALCHDPEIQAAFPDGILWVVLGEQPPKPLDLLNSKLASLEPSRSGATTLEEAQDRWREALRDRVCRF